MNLSKKPVCCGKASPPIFTIFSSTKAWNMLKKRLQSFVYALRGWQSVIQSEPNARIHLLFSIAVIAMGLGFGVSPSEWRWLVLCIALVLAAEAINTAIESIVDLVSPQQHPLAGKAKDTAAGAVLLLALGAVFIGLSIFLPYVNVWLQ
jgi:diacylglycerol kinase (ATP)